MTKRQFLYTPYVKLVLVFLVMIFGMAFTIGSGGGGSSSPPPPPPPPEITVNGLTADPENRNPVFVGRTMQFKATAAFSDGSTADVTNSVTWTSSDVSKATIDSNGLATGKAAGETAITASDTATSSQSNPITLKVSAGTLTSIAVTKNRSGTIPVGIREILTATGTFSDGHTEDLTHSVSWFTADEDIAAITNDGLNVYGSVTVRGISAGTVKISASGYVSANDPTPVSGSMDVEVVETTVTALTITPASPAALPEKYKFTRKFTVEAEMSDGSKVDGTESVIWASDAPAIATVSDSPGTKGLATALTAGSAKIKASIGSLSDEVTLTVNTDTVDTLRLSPSDPSPIPIGVYEEFTLTGIFANGVERDMTLLETVIWQISGSTTEITDTSVASISNLVEGPFNYKGQVLGLKEGTAYVSAKESVGNLSTTAVKIMVAPQDLVAVAVFLEKPTGDEGIVALTCKSLSGGELDVFQFKAIGYYSGTVDTLQDLTKIITWTSSDADVVTVVDQPEAQKGFVACGATGTATITATVPYTSPVIMAPVVVTVTAR